MIGGGMLALGLLGRRQRTEQNRLNAEITKIRKQFAVGPEVEHARLQLMREYDAAKTQYAELLIASRNRICRPTWNATAMEKPQSW